MHTVVLDIFEKPEMELHLAKTLNVQRHNLVSSNLADIYWVAYDHRICLEHKTIEEAMTEMGGRLDTQLRRYTNHCDEVGLVVDGIATPVPGERACTIWEYRPGAKEIKPKWKKRPRPGQKGEQLVIHKSWEEWQAYLWSLDKLGITVYQAPDLQSLCLAVSSYVYNSLKPDHSTLKRYIKTRPIHADFDQDVHNLMNLRYTDPSSGELKSAGIGELTAQKLLDIYKTTWGVLTAQYDHRWPVSKQIHTNIKRAISRPF